MIQVASASLWLLFGCNGSAPDTGTHTGDTHETEQELTQAELSQATGLSPMPSLPADPTNAWADVPEAAHLGQFLFFDTRLSGTGEFSCATCHDPAHGFSDEKQLSEAAGTTARHAPSALNSAFQDFLFWDGRADTLWCQALGPLEDSGEQATTRLAVAHLVTEDADLSVAYAQVFGAVPDLSDTARFPAEGKPVAGEPDHPHAVAWAFMTTEDQEIVNEVFVHVGKAIAAYERKLIREDAPFDAWIAEVEDGQPESELISREAKAGLSLFLGEGNCILCHSGPLFSNKAFHNIGLEDRDWLTPFDNGRFNGISSLLDNPFNGSGRFSDDVEAGSLKIDHLVQGIEQLGAYKTPSLRNLPDTAPYMHGGHFETLTEVVESYSKLEELPSVGHREQFMEPLDWDDNEIASMVAFLESLQGAPLDAALNGPPDSPIPLGDSD